MFLTAACATAAVIGIGASPHTHCAAVCVLQRTLVVDKPDLGYGLKGIGEMPANATFELKVEVLDVFPPA